MCGITSILLIHYIRSKLKMPLVLTHKRYTAMQHTAQLTLSSHVSPLVDLCSCVCVCVLFIVTECASVVFPAYLSTAPHTNTRLATHA